jgi:hypothetical protein
MPGVFGIFYYRSLRPRTLASLRRYFPIPEAQLRTEWSAGIAPERSCARTLRALRALGITRFYLSNLGARETGARLASILAAANTDP